MEKKYVSQRNSQAWDFEAEQNHWATVPISTKEYRELKKNGFPVSWTGSRPVPEQWFGNLEGKEVLCIASGGGQQVILMAAKGAKVTSLENSQRQLLSDLKTAKKYRLKINGIHGSMDDPGVYPNKKFDLIVLGMGAQFIENLEDVFTSISRCMAINARFIGSFVNPICYIFDLNDYNDKKFTVKYKIPYSDLKSLSEKERIDLIGEDAPIEFGHSIEQIFCGLFKSGLVMNGYIEEFDKAEISGNHFPSYFSLLASHQKSIG